MREARVDVDDLGAALLGLHYPLETDRVIFRHVRAFYQDTIRVLQILLERGGATPTEAGSQTGNRGGVSNPSLIFYLDDAQGSEQLLDEIVLFVIERGPAQVRDSQCAV